MNILSKLQYRVKQYLKPVMPTLPQTVPEVIDFSAKLLKSRETLRSMGIHDIKPLIVRRRGNLVTNV